MERFVQAIVAAGVALVAGLWLVDLSEATSIRWLAGLALVGLAVVGFSWGIWSEVEF